MAAAAAAATAAAVAKAIIDAIAENIAEAGRAAEMSLVQSTLTEHGAAIAKL